MSHCQISIKNNYLCSQNGHKIWCRLDTPFFNQNVLFGGKKKIKATNINQYIIISYNIWLSNQNITKSQKVEVEAFFGTPGIPYRCWYDVNPFDAINNVVRQIAAQYPV